MKQLRCDECDKIINQNHDELSEAPFKILIAIGGGFGMWKRSLHLCSYECLSKSATKEYKQHKAIKKQCDNEYKNFLKKRKLGKK